MFNMHRNILVLLIVAVHVQSLLINPRTSSNTRISPKLFMSINENTPNEQKRQIASETQLIQESGLEETNTESNNESDKQWILLVDDEKDIRDAVGQYLSIQGYKVSVCPDAESALQILNSNKNPNLIISDIVMPTKNGLDFLKEIRSTPMIASIPVILLTAKGNTEDRVLGYKYGADAYLPKPFDPEELLSIIQSVILNYNTLNQPLENVDIENIQRDLQEIKKMLMQEGGVGGVLGKKKVFLIPDERRVLELLCEGLTNKEIASEMFISQRRVEQHITSMFRKTEVGNRTELVRWAFSTGYVKI